jgi:hypothetical protein
MAFSVMSLHLEKKDLEWTDSTRKKSERISNINDAGSEMTAKMTATDGITNSSA